MIQRYKNRFEICFLSKYPENDFSKSWEVLWRHSSLYLFDLAKTGRVTNLKLIICLRMCLTFPLLALLWGCQEFRLHLNLYQCFHSSQLRRWSLAVCRNFGTSTISLPGDFTPTGYLHIILYRCELLETYDWLEGWSIPSRGQYDDL